MCGALAKCPLILGGHLLGVRRYAGGVGGWDVPWQELCDAIDRVVGNMGQYVSEIAFRVDAVELGCTEQRVDGGGAFSAAVRASEQIVFLPSATTRNARSAALLSISMVPSSR